MSLKPTTLGFSILDAGDTLMIQRKNYDLELLQKHFYTQEQVTLPLCSIWSPEDR